MKTRTLLSLSFLVVCAVSGCDTASADACDVVVPAFRGISTNGVSMNGVSMQGMSLNGVSLNGKSLNGKSLNGAFNGISLNGIELSDTVIASELGSVDEVALVGTALVGTAASGATVVGQDWVGAVIQASVGTDMIDLQIAKVEPDATDPTIEWYVLQADGESLCADGGRGLFMAGVWDESGTRHDALRGPEDIAYTFACDTGVLAKCIDWGYAPYAVGTDAHQTCSRLARADYCGDGTPHTANGTLIDVFDTLGVQDSDQSIDLAFEAGWGPDGALCVSRPRYVELGSDGDEVAVSCWDELPVCDSVEQAMNAGATLMNRSAPQTLCHE